MRSERVKKGKLEKFHVLSINIIAAKINLSGALLHLKRSCVLFIARFLLLITKAMFYC